ncbi:MAG: hypothetical protein ACRD3S_11450, partial [Terracidiphilus sp.]
MSSDHINVGVYGNFFRLSDSDIDLGGVGARLSVNLMPRVQLEAESAYNFEAAYSQGFSDNNGTVTVSRSHVRSLDWLFGPKIYTNKGPVRLFATAKGGFINFNLSTSPSVTIHAVSSTFQGINGTNTYGVFYPGGGAEAFWGPFGVRVDVGDEMFFNNGAHNNLRVSFGPTIRF